MPTPSDKSEEIEQLLEELFGRTSAIESDTCVHCGGGVVEFRDELSESEYVISGLCQKCQDEFFLGYGA